MFQLEDKIARESLTQQFCSIQAFNRLDGAHPHWGGQSALHSLSIQMLISSRNILTGTPRIMFNEISGHSVVQLN